MQQGFTRFSSWYDLSVAGWLVYILIFLVTFRVTRLIIEDTFPPIGVPREAIMNWWVPDEEWLHTHPDDVSHWGALGRSLRYLFSCPWCMSVWVGAGVVYVFTLYESVPLPYAAWIASSAVTGLLASLEEKLSS